MAKFIVVVLDGFGIGAMEDVPRVRPSDIGSNTCVHIFEALPDLELPTLSRLGLANAAGCSFAGLRPAKDATFGRSRLAHYWADTFFGHQEIMGTKPKVIFGEPINNGKIELIQDALNAAGFKTRLVRASGGLRFIVVEEACTIADNIECDPGQAFNVTCALDDLPFATELEIGRIVRGIAKVPRVITFGGHGVHLDDLLSAVEVHGDYIGVNAPVSGVYNSGYQCVHMGYGVDEKQQVPFLLGERDIKVHLLGKVADVCANRFGESESIIDTSRVLSRALELVCEPGNAFICANVQETDLAGHSQDYDRYADRLCVADGHLGEILDSMADDDLLVVMADHGNDPTIGHPHHTRECVPLLIGGKGEARGDIGERMTLSDVGATVAEFFGVKSPENGESFLRLIR